MARSSILFLVAALVCGCGPVISQSVATNGQVFTVDGYPYDLARPIAVSGAHDLDCPLEYVTASQIGRDWFADGCGQRAVYHATCSSGRFDDPASGDGVAEEGAVLRSAAYVCRFRLVGHFTVGAR